METIKNNGGSAEHLIIDISNVKDTQNKINQIDYFDILVNSAGIAKHSHSLKTKEYEFDVIIMIIIENNLNKLFTLFYFTFFISGGS